MPSTDRSVAKATTRSARIWRRRASRSGCSREAAPAGYFEPAARGRLDDRLLGCWSASRGWENTCCEAARGRRAAPTRVCCTPARSTIRRRCRTTSGAASGRCARRPTCRSLTLPRPGARRRIGSSASLLAVAAPFTLVPTTTDNMASTAAHVRGCPARPAPADSPLEWPGRHRAIDPTAAPSSWSRLIAWSTRAVPPGGWVGRRPTAPTARAGVPAPRGRRSPSSAIRCRSNGA